QSPVAENPYRQRPPRPGKEYATTSLPPCKPRENARGATYPPAPSKERILQRTLSDPRRTCPQRWDGTRDQRRRFDKILRRLFPGADPARNRFLVQTGADSQRRSPLLHHRGRHVHAPRESIQHAPCAALPWSARARAVLHAAAPAPPQPSSKFSRCQLYPTTSVRRIMKRNYVAQSQVKGTG